MAPNKPTGSAKIIPGNFSQFGNWLDFTIAYISATVACADAYLAYDKSKKPLGIESYARVAFIPAFWNFKHALELGIKFLFSSSDKPWGHDLIENIGKYKQEKNLTDEECKELKEMCEKYGELKPLQKLKDVKGNDFIPPFDYENQFFHYPEGHTSHKSVYDLNNHFAYYSLGISQPDDNGKIMHVLMEELKSDALSFAKILR